MKILKRRWWLAAAAAVLVAVSAVLVTVGSGGANAAPSAATAARAGGLGQLAGLLPRNHLTEESALQVDLTHETVRLPLYPGTANGKTVWYDLQTPRSTEFWLAGVDVETGAKTRYKLERQHWSVHFNQSPDGKLFAGDGGGPSSVAAPGNGQWIYLYTPKDGKLEVEKLVDLTKHNYKTEPNVTFTPDSKWIVFRSNLHGPTHVYAVEVKKSK